MFRREGSFLRFQRLCKAFGCRKRSTSCSWVLDTGESTKQTRLNSDSMRVLRPQTPTLTLGPYGSGRKSCHRYRSVHSSSFSDMERIAKALVDPEDPHHQVHPAPETFPFEGDTPKGVPSITGDLTSAEVDADSRVGEEGRAKAENDSFTVGRSDTREGRFYHIVTRGQKSGEFSLPSVTTVLESTMPPTNYYSLMNWRRGQIKELGEDVFKRMNAERLRIGTRFHKQLESRLLRSKTQMVSIKSRLEDGPKAPLSCNRHHHCTLQELSDQRPGNGSHPPEGERETEQSPLGLETSTRPVEASSLEDGQTQLREPVTQDAQTSRLLKSVQHVLDDITEVVALETVVTHLSLGYMGTCDCIAQYRGQLCVVDWKTSSKPRPLLSDCYDYPLQAAAYAGAVNQDPNYPFKVYSALIVVGYLTGEPAHAHFLSHQLCLEAWDKWLQRLDSYRTRFAHDLTNVYV